MNEAPTMKIQKNKTEGYTLRSAPSEAAVAVIVLIMATGALLLLLTDLTRPLLETVAALMGCALLYAAGAVALVKEHRRRLIITEEGVLAYDKFRRRRVRLPWADVREWGVATVSKRGKDHPDRPHTVLYFSPTPTPTPKDETLLRLPHTMKLVKFEEEDLKREGVWAYCEARVTVPKDGAPPVS